MYSVTTEIRNILGKQYLETIQFKDGVIIHQMLEPADEIDKQKQISIWGHLKNLAERKLQKLNQL